ncbi:MAG: CarD family transcriptional regulator [Coriobacteriia bacterium]|nr:CarD family transcriptional regulator [Coriobacteriia bacterium]
MYQPGEIVVYRHHVCQVACVREKYFNEQDYLELHALFENSLKLYVVADDARPPLVRPPMEPAQASALLESIPEIPAIDEAELRKKAGTSTLLERKMREAYETRSKSPRSEDLVAIIKTARRRTARREKAGRSIATLDRKYHDMAMKFICTEMCMSLGVERDEMERMVTERMGAPLPS